MNSIKLLSNDSLETIVAEGERAAAEIKRRDEQQEFCWKVMYFSNERASRDNHKGTAVQRGRGCSSYVEAHNLARAWLLSNFDARSWDMGRYGIVVRCTKEPAWM